MDLEQLYTTTEGRRSDSVATAGATAGATAAERQRSGATTERSDNGAKAATAIG